LFGWKAALDQAAAHLREQQHALTAIELSFELDRKHLLPRRERLETAAPTLDVMQVVDLLRLRLQTVALPARVERIVTTLEHTRVYGRQLAIQHGEKPRDLEAAARAIARLRASLGPEAVSCARLSEVYLPEAAFRFEPARELRLPRAVEMTGAAPLVRRLYASPIALPPRPSHEPEAWLGAHGAITAMLGPSRISDGWWSERGTAERDYYFVETQQGKLLWMFYDRARRKWFLHGVVD
jgi:protein ImuB